MNPLTAPTQLADQTVLVLGLGDSGLAMAAWCARFGASVQVWDSREAPPQAQALRDTVPQARWRHSAALTASDLAGVQLVLKSPGLAPHDARIAELLAAATAQGVPVAGELELFAQALLHLKATRGYAPQVLAITGTNGKTTTTALCALMVARCGRRVASAGNIGPTLLNTLAEALDREPAVEPEAAAVPVDTGPEAVDLGAADVTQGVQAEQLASRGDASHTAIDDASDADTDAEADGQPKAADDDAPLGLVPPAPPPAFEVLPEVWVLELSSFQLHGVQGFAPQAATVLNISQDHLDWHGSLEAYAADKALVFGPQAVMVVNRDDPAVEAMVPAPVVTKPAARGQRARTEARQVLRFGLDAPQHPGDFGIVTENGMAWLVRALECDASLKRRKDEVEEIHIQRLMPADALRIRGRHNAGNALAALALATAIGCPLAPMLHGLREYTGEPHRVAFVSNVAGVDAFDDSKGTNVGATVAAINGLGADKAPAKLLLILGGDGKGQDFAPLVDPVSRHARAIALIGRDADRIGVALVATGVLQQSHNSLEAAVAWCYEQARSGDALLLSPACASLDMFRNYGHRAEVFVAAVHAHAHALGEVA